MSKILTGLNESTYRKYDNNRTGFSRGRRDDERHDLDVQRPAPQEWALKINGKVWSKDGKTVTFTSKEKALKARESLLARRPELEVGLVTRGGVAEAGTGLDIDRSIPGRTIARVSDRANSVSSKTKSLSSYADKDDDYDQWSGKVDPSIHDDEEDTFDTDYTGDEEGELKEISNDALAKYKTAAAADAKKADSEGDYKRGNKRFSGIVKATKKQFANDTKPKSAISQGVNENLGDSLKSNALNALLKVKQNIEQQRQSDLDQWEQDFNKNVVDKFRNNRPQLSPVARPGEKFSVLKARLSELDKAIEKQKVLDKLVQQVESKGLLTPALQADTDTSMYVRGGAKDNYVALNQKLDKALDIIRSRLSTNKVAFSKAKNIEEDIEELDENLHKWFKEKWVRFGPDGKIRGDCARGDDSEGKPKCLPQSKAHSLGKKGRASAAARKRREDPNPERSGKAINVNTKKKTNEAELDEACWKGYHKEGNKKMFGKTYPNCVKNTNEEQEQIDEKCWDTHKQVGMKSKGGKQVPNCVPKESIEEHHSESCPHCGGEMVSEELMNEKKDACYYKVKSRYKVWPSAYASGALVKCRKKGADSWGNGGKKNESIEEDQLDEKWTKKYKDSINCSNPKGFSQKAHCAGKKKNESAIFKGLK